jgi:hypothetical protein
MSQGTAERAAPSDDPIPPSAPPRRTEMTDATRHLCVGAYIDDYFRDGCLRLVYYQNKRFVAPSYGFDVAVVLDQCLRARNLTIWRDATIVIALASAAYLNWLSVVGVAAALICIRVTSAVWRLLHDFIGRVRTGTAVDTTKSPRRGLALLFGWAIACLVFIAIVSKIISSATASFLGTEGAVHRAMSSGGALALALVVFAVPAAFALWRQKRIEYFTSNSPAPPVRPTGRMQQIIEQGHGNTVVYSGFEPFVGSGDVIHTWGFAQRLVRKTSDDPRDRFKTATEGEREFEEPPFTAKKLVDYLRCHLTGLASDGMAEQRIPDMTVEDRVFHSAHEWGERTLVTPPERMAEIIRNPTMPARHYLACQVVSWLGELVTTVHVHVALQGRSLYLEITTTCIAPCNERYRIVDMDGGTGFPAWMRALRNGIFVTPRTIVRAPGRLGRSLVAMIGSPGSAARMGLSRRRYDSGTRTSVRMLGTRDKLRNFTQRQDILKFRRLIERRVIAHVLDFLDDHKIDTTEYRARAASVLNVGIGHFGDGDMTFNQQVTGQQMTGGNESQQQPDE